MHKFKTKKIQMDFFLRALLGLMKVQQQLFLELNQKNPKVLMLVFIKRKKINLWMKNLIHLLLILMGKKN